MHSWRPRSHKQYDVYIKRWTTFCLQRKINSREPNVNYVLTFLHEFPKRRLSYSTINPARFALSSYLMVFQFHGTLQPRTQGTFWNESTLVDRCHVVSFYCPDFGQ